MTMTPLIYMLALIISIVILLVLTLKLKNEQLYGTVFYRNGSFCFLWHLTD